VAAAHESPTKEEKEGREGRPVLHHHSLSLKMEGERKKKKRGGGS